MEIPTSPKAIGTTILVVVLAVMAYNFLQKQIPQLPSLVG